MFDSLLNFVRNEHQIGQCKTLTAFNPRSSVCSPHFTLTEHQTLSTLGELSPSAIWIKRILRRPSSTLSWSVRVVRSDLGLLLTKRITVSSENQADVISFPQSLLMKSG